MSVTWVIVVTGRRNYKLVETFTISYCERKSVICIYQSIKPRASGRNIVGQQLPTFFGCYTLRPLAHPAACCCVLLGVVAQSLKPIKLLATCKQTQQLPTSWANNVGSCCVRFHVLLKVPTIDTNKDTKKPSMHTQKNFHTLTTVRRKARRKAVRENNGLQSVEG